MLKKDECYRFNRDGYFVGIMKRQIDPLGSKRLGYKIYSLPGKSTLKEISEIPEGYLLKFENNDWVLEKIPEPEPEVPESELTEEEIEFQRVETLISEKQREILRRMAIYELQQEGKIT